MPEATGRLPSYQARLLERTSQQNTFSLNRNGSILSRSSSSASSATTANTNTSSLFGANGKSWSGGSLSEEVIDEESPLRGKGIETMATTDAPASTPVRHGKRGSVSSVKGMWEQRIQDAEDVPSSPVPGALGRANSIRQATFIESTTPRDLKRRTIPATYSGATVPKVASTTTPTTSTADMTSTPAQPQPSSTASSRVRRTISFDSPPAAPPSTSNSSPSRTSITRTLTDQVTPTTSAATSTTPLTADGTGERKFRSAYMASKHAHSISLDSPPPTAAPSRPNVTQPSARPSRSSSIEQDVPSSSTPLGIGRRLGRRLERIVSGEVAQDESKENHDPAPSSIAFPTRERSVSPTKTILQGATSGLSRGGSVRMAIRERERADSLVASGSAASGSRPASPLKHSRFDSLGRSGSISTTSQPPSPLKRSYVSDASTMRGKEAAQKESSPTFPVFEKLRPSTAQSSPKLPATENPTTPRKDRTTPSYVNDLFGSPTRQTTDTTSVTRKKTLSFSSTRDREVRVPASPAKDALPPSTPRTPRLRHQASHDALASSGALPLLPAPPTQDELAHDDGEDGEVEVHGIPGRIRLSRNLHALPVPASPVRGELTALPKAPVIPANAGTPKVKISQWALWADRNRQDIQAYEYLCRVGEAKAWIEAAMEAESEMEIPEWEEKMRDGVALARLVKKWGAEGKVFEHPKLQWRHSDNVNIFLKYVRDVGLPENFVFELTDLYEKKNMPKVIYCIHALSHLLARQGIAQRIGSLLGTLEFSDDQLAATQKGLNGVAMPNFGNVGRELWKEMKEEVVETEEERIERELLEQEESIELFQTAARGFLARRRCAEKLSRLDRLEPSIIGLQSLSRGCIARRKIAKQRRAVKAAEGTFIVAVQAQTRGALARGRYARRKRELERPSTAKIITGLQSRARGLIARKRVVQLSKILDHVEPNVVWAQTVLRGVLVRRKIRQLLAKLDTLEPSITALQAAARGALARRRRQVREEQQAAPQVVRSIVGLQSRARGLLKRRRAAEVSKQIGAVIPSMVGLQAQVRGAMVRQRIRAQLARLDSHEDAVIRFQAVAHGFLARKQYRSMAKDLRKATPVFVGLQARARAMLAQKKAKDLEKALAQVQVVQAVSFLQAFARAALTRKRHQEQAKQLEFVAPDVLGLQAQCRGVLSRRAFGWWWHYVHQHQTEATHLQALCRGIMVRRRFVEKMKYYRANLSKVVKIQSLFRAKEQREQYRQLTMGQNVTVSTIKNFVHLLNDSEFDFSDEIEVERLRKRVVEAIRENQQLETYVTDLDVKIALVVQNVKTFEDLVKARWWGGLDNSGAHTSRAAVLAAHGDPFAGPNTLDIATKRKLELYQQLFYLLQTKGEYLGRLFFRMSRVEMPEKTKRIVERVTLTLFAYGQRREEYLMLKLFQHAISEEARAAPSMTDVIESHPMFLSIALQYVRPKQVAWLREALQTLVEEIIGQPAYNLETDPVMIYRAVINAEETKSGVSSGKPVDVTFEQAAFDAHTRAEWVRHLQVLRHYTELFLNALITSTRKMPYSIRSFARDLMGSLKDKFPGQSDEAYAMAVARMVYFRFIHPAIVAPDTFDIIPTTIGAAARRNLAEVARMLTQVSSGGPFQESVPSLAPLNAFVKTGIEQMQKWALEVTDISNAEEQFKAHEFLDATEQPSSILISPNEVYAIHALLAQNLDHLTTAHDDILRIIIVELDGVPHLGSDELRDARDRPVTLELTNRFADVKDPDAGEKALWVHAKRGVLAVLRVQPSKDLMSSLMTPVDEEHEATWADIVAQELPSEQDRNKKMRLPVATSSDPAYRLQDIRTQSYRDIKAQAMFYLLELEKLGKLTRVDGFQGILNAIAGDVRSKHMKRMQRKNELESMEEALRHLAERKKAFEDQIKSYHSYIDSAMTTMQRGKGKKKFVMPFTKQYFHLRDLHKAGKNPQFGSYKYSAQELYDKGILLSIDKFSPRQFDRISLVISSDQVGEFSVEMFNNSYGAAAPMGSATLRMEDLLQSQFENRVSLPLFDSLAKVNLNLLLYQINKKFYV